MVRLYVYNTMSNRSLPDSVNVISTLKKHELLKDLKCPFFYQSQTSLEASKLWNRFCADENASDTDLLKILASDQQIVTKTCSKRRRRSVHLKRSTNCQFGFTIQTYIIQKQDGPVKISYIDYVHFDGPAADAGIRPGDVIISINGLVVTELPHNELVALINSCQEMRMVIIFENIRERIQLVARAIRLKKLLNDKLYQLNLLDKQEQAIFRRAYARKMASINCNVLSDLNHHCSPEVPFSQFEELSSGSHDKVDHVFENHLSGVEAFEKEALPNAVFMNSAFLDRLLKTRSFALNFANQSCPEVTRF